jgi:CBS domain-containing protein
MQLRELMTAPPAFVYMETPLWRAARAMDHSGCGFLPVVQNGVAQGVVTTGDLLRAVVIHGRCPYATTASQVMTSPPIGINADRAAGDAVEMIHERCVRRLVVTDERGILRGIVGLGDLARAVRDDSIARTVEHLAHHSSSGFSGETARNWAMQPFVA